MDARCGNETVTELCTSYQFCKLEEEYPSTRDVSNDYQLESIGDLLPLPLTPIDYIVITYYSILFCIGLLGNSIVLVGMLCNYTHMITSSHVFAIHMAIADLLLILLLPLHIIEHRDHGDWLAGTALCSISNTCQVMNFIVSIFLLTLMAADRYIAIVGKYRPVSFKQKPPKIAHVISGLVWIAAFLLSFPVWRYSTVTNSRCNEDWGHLYLSLEEYNTYDNQTKQHCSIKLLQNNTYDLGTYDVPYDRTYEDFDDSSIFDDLKQMETTKPISNVSGVKCEEEFADVYDFCDTLDVLCVKSSEKCGAEVHGINECLCPVSSSVAKYNWMIFVLTFFLPLIIIVYCYSRFLQSIYSVTRNVSSSTAMSTNHQNEIRRLTILIMTLITAFIICWTPVQVTNVLQTSGFLTNVCTKTCKVLVQFKKNLVWLSAVINSIIYMSTTGFRRRLKEYAANLFNLKSRRSSLPNTMETTPMTVRITMTNSTYSTDQLTRSET